MATWTIAHWKNYLAMVEIVDYLTAPDITEDEVGYLSVLAEETAEHA